MRVHQLFQHTCKDFSGEQAVTFSNESLTYQQLDDRSNQLAHYLVSLGIKEKEKIGVYFPRSLWHVTFMLALSKIGAVYVPFNPSDTTTEGGDSYKKHRDQIADCELTRLMTCASHKERANNFKTSAQNISLTITTLELNQINKLPKASLEFTDNSDEVDAYIMYSSGTTGAPKGIPIKHKGLDPWFHALEKVIAKGKDNRVAAQIPNGFDAHIWEYLMAWSCGGCSYIADDQIVSNPVELVHFIIKNKIHDLTMTPAVMGRIMKNQKHIDEMATAGLQRVYLTGEEITPDIVVALKKQKIQIFNCYGPTELTFGYSMHEVSEKDIDKDTNLVAIGLKSHNGVQGFIRRIDPKDDSKLIEPIETAGDIDEGELLVASSYMTAGYIHQTEDNKNNFQEIEHQGKKLRVYSTQDILMLKGGKLFYKGRLGDVIKFKSVPINTITIAKAIEAEFKKLTNTPCPRVLVFDVKLATGQHYLVAVLEVTDESQWHANSKKQLREKLTTQSALDSRDVPQFFYNLKELGLTDMPTKTGSGKTDISVVRKYAYKKIQSDSAVNKDVSAKLANELTAIRAEKGNFDINKMIELAESILLQLINDVRGDNLSYPEICKKNLHELGFQSLDSMGLHLEIEKYFGQSISQAAFEKKMIADLVQELISPQIFRSCFQDLRTLHDPKEVDPDHPVVFCLPPITGAISQYKALDVAATRLLAFESPLLNRGLLKHQDLYQAYKKFYCQLSMEDAAKHIARAINVIQTNGDIYLGGWSFGGDLAWAVATQLRVLGRTVKSVFILDSQAPRELAEMPGTAFYQRLVGITEMILKEILTTEDDKKKLPIDVLVKCTSMAIDNYQGDELSESRKKLIEHFYLLLQKKLEELQIQHLELNEKIERMQALFATCSAHALMLLSWRPDEMGTVTLDRSQLPPTVIFRAKDGIHECKVDSWKKYVGEGCEVVEVERDHFKILESEAVLIKFRDKFAARLPYSKTLRGALRKYYGSQSSIPLVIFNNERMPLSEAINIALVSSKQQQLHEAGLINPINTNRLRNFEDVFRFEKEVDFKTIFDLGSRHIVIGRAGIGKSTFVRIAVHRWSRGEIWQQFKDVIAVSLRHLQNYKATIQGNEASDQEVAKFVVWALRQDNTLDESLTRYITVEAISKLLSSEDSDSNALWLLDGFDEVEVTVKSGAAKLIFERLKKQRNIIITSRPNAISQSSLNRDFESKFELLGFKEEDIERCVLAIYKIKNPATAEVQAALFVNLLKSHPNLWGLAHVPINIEIMASVLDPSDLISGEFMNMATLYRKVVSKLMQRYLVKELGDNVPQTDHSIAKLTGDLECYLSRLAFSFMRQNKLYFNDDELVTLAEEGGHQEKNELERRLSNFILTLHKRKNPHTQPKEIMDVEEVLVPVHNCGLLNSIVTNTKKQNYFLHLTFQEYYAALELCQHHRSNVTLLQEMFSDSRYETTLQFYAGLIAKDVIDLQRLFDAIDAVFVKRTSDSPYQMYKSQTDDTSFYHYEIDPEIMCRAILLLEQCPTFSVRQSEAIFRAIRRAVGIGLVKARLNYEYNFKHRKNIIDTLKCCPRVLQKSRITAYLQEMVDDPDTKEVHLYKIVSSELSSIDYFDCLEEIIKTSSDFKAKLQALTNLLPYIDNDVKACDKVIGLLCDFKNQTIATLVQNVIIGYPRQEQVIFDRIETAVFQATSSASKKMGAIKILACKRNAPIEKLIPIARELLGSDESSIRYEAAKFLQVFLESIDIKLEVLVTTALKKNIIFGDASLILPNISLVLALYGKFTKNSNLTAHESMQLVRFWCWPNDSTSLLQVLKRYIDASEQPVTSFEHLHDIIVKCGFTVVANTENNNKSPDDDDNLISESKTLSSSSLPPYVQIYRDLASENDRTRIYTAKRILEDFIESSEEEDPSFALLNTTNPIVLNAKKVAMECLESKIPEVKVEAIKTIVFCELKPSESQLLNLLHEPLLHIRRTAPLLALDLVNDHILNVLIDMLHNEYDFDLLKNILHTLGNVIHTDENAKIKLLLILNTQLNNDLESFVDEQLTLMIYGNNIHHKQAFSEQALSQPKDRGLMHRTLSSIRTPIKSWLSCFWTPPIPKARPNTMTTVERGYYELYGLFGANYNVGGLCQVINALGKLAVNSTHCLKLLLNSLNHSNLNVRMFALAQLQQVAVFSDDDFALLVTLNQDDEGENGENDLQQCLLVKLVRSDSRYFNQLTPYINYPLPQVCLRVIRVLVEINSLIQRNGTLRQDVINKLDAPNDSVRLAAIKLVGKFEECNEDEVRVMLEKLIILLADPLEEIQSAAVESLGKMLNASQAMEDKMLDGLSIEKSLPNVVKGIAKVLGLRCQNLAERLTKRVTHLTLMVRSNNLIIAAEAIRSLCFISRGDANLFQDFKKIFIDNPVLQSLRTEAAITVWENDCYDSELRNLFESYKDSDFTNKRDLQLCTIEALMQSESVNQVAVFKHANQILGLWHILPDRLKNRLVAILDKPTSFAKDFLDYVEQQKKSHKDNIHDADVLNDLYFISTLLLLLPSIRSFRKAKVNSDKVRDENVLLNLVSGRIINAIERIVYKIMEEPDPLVIALNDKDNNFGISALVTEMPSMARPNNKVTELLLKLATHKQRDMRGRATEALGEVKYYDDKIKPRLINLLSDPDSFVQAASLRGLSTLQYPEVEVDKHENMMTTIISLTHEQIDVVVRIDTLKAIKKLQFISVSTKREIAIRILHDPSYLIRRFGLKLWSNDYSRPKEDINLLTKWLTTENDPPTIDTIIEKLTEIAITVPSLMLLVITNLNLHYYQNSISVSDQLRLLPQISNPYENSVEDNSKANLKTEAAATTDFFKDRTSMQQPQAPHLQSAQSAEVFEIAQQKI